MKLPGKGKKWPWVVGGIFIIGLIGSTIDPVEKPATPQETSPSPQQSTTITTVKQEEKEPAKNQDINAGKAFESWYLGQYDQHTWDYLCGKYGGWQCNILSVDSPEGLEDTIVLVTNLSSGNEDGVRRANEAIKSVQNQAKVSPEMKEATEGKAEFVQAWDAQGNVLASDGIEYGE